MGRKVVDGNLGKAPNDLRPLKVGDLIPIENLLMIWIQKKIVGCFHKTEVSGAIVVLDPHWKNYYVRWISIRRQ